MSQPLSLCPFLERPKECIWWSDLGRPRASGAEEEPQVRAAMNILSRPPLLLLLPSWCGCWKATNDAEFPLLFLAIMTNAVRAPSSHLLPVWDANVSALLQLDLFLKIMLYFNKYWSVIVFVFVYCLFFVLFLNSGMLVVIFFSPVTRLIFRLWPIRPD